MEHFTDNYQMQVFDLTNKKQLGEYHGLSQGQRFFIVGVINYELAWRRKELLDLYDFTLMLDEYLQDAYHNGYIGNMYSLQKQGIPITVPIDQKKVLTALQTDSKLSSKYHSGDSLYIQIFSSFLTL